jgi:glycosyltransferase involved in cell wall biosynthesis
VGDGPVRAQAEALADRSIEFAGFQPIDEVRRLMLQARVLLFPSRWYEMFALTLVEALAAGLPVVASRLGGIPEVLGDAALSMPSTHEQWVDALNALRDARQVGRACVRARHRYERLYSEHTALHLLESAYAWACQRPGR